MGINAKGKRKIVLDEKVYWWSVKELQKTPRTYIISDDKTFIAECRLYSPVLQVKKSLTGKREIAVPQLEKKHGLIFTPQYIRDLIEVGNA